MDRREPLTRADVERAITELAAAGPAVPTCRAVRDALGGGSMTTISRMMREIEHASATPATVPVSLTPAQTARATQMMEALLGELRQEDRAEAERVKCASAERVAAAERRADELAEAVDAEQQAAEERLRLAADETAELRRQAAKSLADKETLQISLIEERTLRLHAEADAAQLRACLQERCEALIAEAAALRSQLEGATNAVEHKQGEMERISRRIEALEALVASEGLARAKAEEKAARLIETEAALLARTEEVGRLRAERDEVLRRRVRKRDKARVGARGDLMGESDAL
ncbi:MAG TPA: DNA-binding protein [Stellaceae bacterium]|nr:DNA-binding protein [Stellaceae bacterium]